MMPSALPWQSYPRGSRPAPHLTLYTRLLRSWKRDNQCVCASTPPDQRCIGRSTGTTSRRRAGWQPWRKRGWHYLTRSQGRTPESEVEVVGGLNVCLAQAMSCYQREEQQCFMWGLPGHFARGCPHREAFSQWHETKQVPKGAGGRGNGSPTPGVASSRLEVNVHMIGRVRNPWLEAGGPTAHWLGPEMLVELTVKGRDFTTLADSGSQVNMITPALVQQCGFPVLPLEDLVDYPVNLVGLGGMLTSPLRFVILHVQVWGITGYDQDAVFLVVPDESDFGRRVPFVVGTCTISRLINVI